MIEVAMLFTLTLMGVYFIKSTDLPKELKERSTQLSTETTKDLTKNIKMTFPKTTTSLAEMQLKITSELGLLHAEIDKLTVEITTLEQEIKINNERNTEIQDRIDSQLISLQSLHERVRVLS